MLGRKNGQITIKYFNTGLLATCTYIVTISPKESSESPIVIDPDITKVFLPIFSTKLKDNRAKRLTISKRIE